MRYLLPLFLMLFCLQGVNAAPDFETQILPILTKQGCNSGSCHGAAIGRGGFRLSLLGHDADADYESLLLEFQGRRVNQAEPAKSLLLRKPSGAMRHEGGAVLKSSSDGYKLVREWIEAGSPREGKRRLAALEISPGEQALAKTGDRFTLKVTARYQDGMREDVTRWALCTPADTASLKVSPMGEVTALRPGRSPVMVRFLGEVGCVLVTVPMAEQRSLSDARPEANFVDAHINRTLDQLRLDHSPRADDTTFVRRIYLDMLGTLPTEAEVKELVESKAGTKRAALVESLFKREEFLDYWAYKWSDLLRVESRKLQEEGAKSYHGWIRNQLKANTPYDRMARDLLLTLGDAHKVGPANFHRATNNPQTDAELISQVFLGVRLQCANCHNHPLDRWTQDDYHGLAAAFAKVGRGREMSLNGRGEVQHPRTGKPATPKLPGAEFLQEPGDARKDFADWLTRGDNAYFARAMVNRIWHDLMGRGLVEPLDDHRATNPATHPDLLDALAAEFIKHNFDVRHLIRVITSSEAYQRSSLAVGNNKTDMDYYSHSRVRWLPPVVLVDAVARVTGVPERLGDLPLGTRAITLHDSKIACKPLDLLGRCHRDEGCTRSEGEQAGLPLALHRFNGSWLNDKIEARDGRLKKMLATKATDEVMVKAFYQQALCRSPSEEELRHWLDCFGKVQGAEREQLWEDFLWALLNSVEFLTNH